MTSMRLAWIAGWVCVAWAAAEYTAGLTDVLAVVLVGLAALTQYASKRAEQDREAQDAPRYESGKERIAAAYEEVTRELTTPRSLRRIL